ncbi:iron-dependent peroxidase [Marinicrinis lubricantis]|uniref:Iron-dependent peroxidase n=1 Tax=Marinicrinis lubricantis TaxID=2086470 RepID=A0ABW1INJ1_9BACL
MNYIWELIIEAERKGIRREHIQFSPAEYFSPYMELSMESLNPRTLEQRIEINPYYRFHELLGDLFDPNMAEDFELRHTLFDIVIHFLGELDLNSGLTKRDFYIRFVTRDLDEGAYGPSIQQRFEGLCKREKEVIAENLLKLHETGEAVYCLTRAARSLFPGVIVCSREDKDELLFFMNRKETEEHRMKLELLKELFAPLWCDIVVFWNGCVGMIGEEQTMVMGDTVLY